MSVWFDFKKHWENYQSQFKRPDNLTNKEILFAYTYVACGCNCSRAYNLVYEKKDGTLHSNKTARDEGSRLIRKPQIANLIYSIMNHIMRKNEITTERILNELSKIAFADKGDVITVDNGILSIKDFADISPDNLEAIQEISQTQQGGRASLNVKFADKVKAIKLMMEWKGMIGNDFNQLIKGLLTYGLEMYMDENGNWVIRDIRQANQQIANKQQEILGNGEQLKQVYQLPNTNTNILNGDTTVNNNYGRTLKKENRKYHKIPDSPDEISDDELSKLYDIDNWNRDKDITIYYEEDKLERYPSDKYIADDIIKPLEGSEVEYGTPQLTLPLEGINESINDELNKQLEALEKTIVNRYIITKKAEETAKELTKFDD